jgi:hypothetical protein
MSRVVAVFALVLLLLGFLSVYFYTHRFQISADNRMLYVVDQWNGHIEVYAVGEKHDDMGDLAVHLIATSHAD